MKMIVDYPVSLLGSCLALNPLYGEAGSYLFVQLASRHR